MEKVRIIDERLLKAYKILLEYNLEDIILDSYNLSEEDEAYIRTRLTTLDWNGKPVYRGTLDLEAIFAEFKTKIRLSGLNSKGTTRNQRSYIIYEWSKEFKELFFDYISNNPETNIQKLCDAIYNYYEYTEYAKTLDKLFSNNTIESLYDEES